MKDTYLIYYGYVTHISIFNGNKRTEAMNLVK